MLQIPTAEVVARRPARLWGGVRRPAHSASGKPVCLSRALRRGVGRSHRKKLAASGVMQVRRKAACALVRKSVGICSRRQAERWGEMRRRLLALAVVGAFAVAVGVATALADGSSPSGERILGGPGFGSGSPVLNDANPQEPVAGAVIEPVYDNGSVTYISTPAKTPNPVKSNPKAAAPIYLPVYPAGTPSSVVTAADLNCNHQNMVGSTQVDNCPDHGDAIANLAVGLGDSNVYGSDPSAILGHDHVLDGPASHGDFNIAWVPEVILFNSNGCTSDPLCNVHRLTSNSEIEAAIAAHTVDVIRLDGTGGFPDLTFHCSVVSQAVWNKAVPWPGTVGS